MNKGQLAKENFKTGVNCAQAVVLAFKDEMGLSEEQLKKLSIGFGGGVARQRHVCGAVLGMAMVLSYLKSDGHDKLAIYDLIQRACGEIKEQLGTIVCSELLDAKTLEDKSPVPEQRTAKYYAKRPCAEICELVATIMEKYLK